MQPNEKAVVKLEVIVPDPERAAGVYHALLRMLADHPDWITQLTVEIQEDILKREAIEFLQAWKPQPLDGALGGVLACIKHLRSKYCLSLMRSKRVVDSVRFNVFGSQD